MNTTRNLLSGIIIKLPQLDVLLRHEEYESALRTAVSGTQRQKTMLLPTKQKPDSRIRYRIYFANKVMERLLVIEVTQLPKGQRLDE